MSRSYQIPWSVSPLYVISVSDPKATTSSIKQGEFLYIPTSVHLAFRYHLTHLKVFLPVSPPLRPLKGSLSPIQVPPSSPCGTRYTYKRIYRRKCNERRAVILPCVTGVIRVFVPRYPEAGFYLASFVFSLSQLFRL